MHGLPDTSNFSDQPADSQPASPIVDSRICGRAVGTCVESGQQPWRLGAAGERLQQKVERKPDQAPKRQGQEYGGKNAS